MINDLNDLNDFEKKVGYSFSDSSLLVLALTHKSCESAEDDNERLEFLGDAVLDLVITEALYHQHPDRNEGTLNRMRADLVNGERLAKCAIALGIDTFLRVGKAQRKHHPQHSAAMLEDALEALVGAIYLDGGIEAARSFILEVFGEAIHYVSETFDSGNPKGRLQEWLQKQNAGATPEYFIVSEEGPGHALMFTAVVKFDGSELGCGQGSSKKTAEIAAAQQALARLDH